MRHFACACLMICMYVGTEYVGSLTEHRGMFLLCMRYEHTRVHINVYMDIDVCAEPHVHAPSRAYVKYKIKNIYTSYGTKKDKCIR